MVASTLYELLHGEPSRLILSTLVLTSDITLLHLLLGQY